MQQPIERLWILLFSAAFLLCYQRDVRLPFNAPDEAARAMLPEWIYTLTPTVSQ
jgi:hypothetical protein